MTILPRFGKLKRHEIAQLGITPNNTAVEVIQQNPGGIVSEIIFVTLHNTDIAKITKYRNGCTDTDINTGGFNTVTTRRRINEVSKAFRLGYHVYQKDYQLYADHEGNTYPFNRTILLQQR